MIHAKISCFFIRISPSWPSDFACLPSLMVPCYWRVLVGHAWSLPGSTGPKLDPHTLSSIKRWQCICHHHWMDGSAHKPVQWCSRPIQYSNSRPRQFFEPNSMQSWILYPIFSLFLILLLSSPLRNIGRWRSIQLLLHAECLFPRYQ